jgi:hypothetical protein
MRIVHSLEELLELPRDEHVNGFRSRESLQLEIPALTHYALADAQEVLNGLQERRVSLIAAGVTLLALMFGVTLVYLTNTTLLTGEALLELAAVLAISIGLGAVAKMAALAFTRWQFERRCREQYDELSRMLREPAFLS